MVGSLSDLRGFVAFGCLVLIAAVVQADDPDSQRPPLSMVVMDPLAAPLSCPCVEGYAQRKYEVLAQHLEKSLGRKVSLVFSEALEKAIKDNAGRRPGLIIGKDSVVRADARDAKLKVTAVARLTDKTGSTMQHGLIVVRHDDSAQKTADLSGYRIIFGPAECDEKHQAAIELLQKASVAVPSQLEIDQACSDGACKVVDLGPNSKAAAVISSYAAPLLEGCGTVKKGDLRVVAKTKLVPFVTAFTSDLENEAEAKKIHKALLSIAEKPEICEALESLIGFIEVKASRPDADKSENLAAKKK